MYKNEVFKICADYVTLVETGLCPTPKIEKSKTPLTRLGAFGTQTMATYYAQIVYTPNKATEIGVPCQVGLYACGTIKDTGFNGGDNACRSVCTKDACTKDIYVNHACQLLSKNVKALGGRKVCSEKSVKMCRDATPEFSYKDKSYNTALDSADIDLLKTLKKGQTDKEIKAFNYVLKDLETYQENLSKNTKEFYEGEILFSEWPEVISEGNILFEQKMEEKKGEVSSGLSSLIRQFMEKKPPTYGPEDDKLHQSYWSDQAVGNTIHDVKSLTRGLSDTQSYELKKMVTDATTFGIDAMKRLKILEAVIKLAKAHYGKHAESYGKAFKESKKVGLWRKILQNIPFKFGVDDRVKVVTGLIPLSEYQLLQVINYGKFHSVYPDELPNTGTLLDHIENVRKLDVRYPETVPSYMKGIELPEVALNQLIGAPTYKDDVRQEIIGFYKKEVKPDITSHKGQKVYRKYTPTLKMKAFLSAVQFLTKHTKDFESKTSQIGAKGDSLKLQVIKRLLSYPYRKLKFLENSEFSKVLKEKVPHENISWYTSLGLKGKEFIIYDSYALVLDLLDKEFKEKK